MRTIEEKRAYELRYYYANREKMLAKRRAKRAANPDTDRIYYHANRERLLQAQKERRDRDPEATKARKKREHEALKAADPLYLERCRIRNRRSYQATRAKRLLRCAEWARTHPDSKHASRVRRRIRLLAVQISIEKIDREAIIKRDKSICHICHKRVARKDLTLDHLIPLFHGGPDTAANLAVAHRSCNASRGTGRLPAQLRLFG